MPTSPSSPPSATSTAAGWWCATARHQPREVLTSAGAVEVIAPRVNDRRIDPDTGRAGAVLLGDPAALVPQDPEDHRGVAAAVPARPVHRGLRARAGPVPRHAPRGCPAPVITRLTETWKAEQRAFAGPGSVRCGLRLPVGRRHPRQHPPRGAQAVPAGHDRRARRRPQGARRPGRRLPGVDRVLGGPAARLRAGAGCAPRSSRSGTARSGSGARYARCSRRPESSAAGSTRSPTFSVRCPSLRIPGAKKALAEIWNAEDKHARPRRGEGLRGRLRREVPQGRREDHRRPRRAARVLRLPRRALDPPAHHEPDRVDLRHRPAPDEDHPRPGLDARPGWRWRSSSSRPPKTAGAPSTPRTSSRSSAPAPRFENGKLVERPDEHPQPEAA